MGGQVDSNVVLKILGGRGRPGRTRELTLEEVQDAGRTLGEKIWHREVREGAGRKNKLLTDQRERGNLAET